MIKNRIPITLNEARQRVTGPTVSYRYDAVQYLVISGIELPEAYAVDFCNLGDETTTPIVGGADGVRIPNKYLRTGKTIIAYLIITGDDENAVETRYEITLPVRSRPKRGELDPTEDEREEIDILVDRLNEAAVEAEEHATAAAASADSASEDAGKAEAAVTHYPKIVDRYWYVWDAEHETWTNTGIKAEGVDGTDGVGIQSLVWNADYTMTITMTNGTVYTSISLRGEVGTTPNLTIGTVTTGAAGSQASATITGTPERPVLNLTIPRGDTGEVSQDDLAEALRPLNQALSDVEDRVDVLEDLEKERGFTPEQLQTIAASGHADEYFQIGDIIYIDWTDNTPATPVTYHVPHVVTHFGDVEDENGVTHSNAMWLMWMYATPQALQFDHPEAIVADEATFQAGYYYYTKNDDNSFTEQTVTVGDPIPTGETYYKHVRSGMAGRLRYGSNDWSQSAYRKWLNSAMGKGEWWTAQHDSDVAPNEANSLPGFLTGYSADWLAIFKPVKVVTALNTVCDGGVDVTTYDRFFLPSLEQMYGSPQKAGVEGDVWEYWIEETGLPSRSNGSSSNTNDARKIPSISAPNGAAGNVRLRSANRSNTNLVWLVSTAGYLNSGYSASSAYRAQPACVIY